MIKMAVDDKSIVPTPSGSIAISMTVLFVMIRMMIMMSINRFVGSRGGWMLPHVQFLFRRKKNKCGGVVVAGIITPKIQQSSDVGNGRCVGTST
jgi:hypothetical protein